MYSANSALFGFCRAKNYLFRDDLSQCYWFFVCLTVLSALLCKREVIGGGGGGITV